jgi:alpha-L-rhamnosidase
MKSLLLFLLMVLLMQSCNKEHSSEFSLVQLKTNNLENPSGTGKNPVFNWSISSYNPDAGQTAYQIVLDAVKGSLEQESDCLWNSGKVISSSSTWIPFSGPELRSGTQYFWKVRVWDKNDKPSGWSNISFFITGLFEKNEWNNAKWIGFEEISDSLLLIPGVHGDGNNLGEVALKRTVIPYFRKEFNLVKRISQALVYVSGLGQYELYINGEKIGDRFLSPGWTNYLKTCYYNTFDVTEQLKRGSNVVGAIVGNGFYNVNRERYRKLVIAYGAPKLILALKVKYSDGSVETIISDETWKAAPSPITFSSIYGGEDYDAMLEQAGWDKPGFGDSAWKPALMVREPGGDLKPECDYPVRIMETFNPVAVFNPENGKYVYDYRQNASGIIKLKIKGQRGQKVVLTPGELITNDSLVKQSASGRPYYFSYILKGDKEEIWIPRFSYYGFRYVQVEGAVPSGKSNPFKLPVITEMQLLHTRNSSPSTGSFRCSNELFNSIYELINWSIKSNLASVATDCPHREKLGWLEQTHLMGNSIKYIYDIHNLYEKIIDDMIGAQLENGLVPDIAPEYVPFVGGFRDSPEWGSACVILPWDMYEWYGDIEAVRKAFPMMKKYLSYLSGKSENHILSHGLGDWYDLGPKFPGEAQLTPKAVTATSIYFYDAKLLAEMAALIGENEDALLYKNMAEEIRIAFNREFFNPETKVYSTGSQTAFAMPLFFGMVDDSCHKDVVENLLTSIKNNNKSLTAGDVGYRYLIRVLEQEGQSQLIYEMNSKTDVPGYGYQLSKGATSLTESWAGLVNVSNNHMMLGHLMEWFFSGLGGIRQTEDSKGYKNILISPEPVGDIQWAETSHQTIQGEIFCSWKITDRFFELHVRIPSNCEATIVIPQPDADKIWEGESLVKASDAIKKIMLLDNKTYLNITSGEYFFKSYN